MILSQNSTVGAGVAWAGQIPGGLNEHGREYLAAIAMIEAHAEIWMPKTEKTA